MKFSSFKYLVKQGWKNMLANRLMSLASFGVLTACLVITGIAVLATLNVNSFMDYIGAQNSVEVYLTSDITVEQRDTTELAIASMTDLIDEFSYVSKEQALQEQMKDLGEYGAFLENYAGENNPSNPLPASFRVAAKNPADVPQLVEKLRVLDGVEEVQTSLELASVLTSLKSVVSICGWSLVLVLGAVSVVVISNTIRLTVFARRKEINIMKFVGATNSFIRMPFFVEGVTVGALAGVFSTGIVCGAYLGLLEYIATVEVGMLKWMVDCIIPLNTIWALVLLGFVAFGIVIGSIGTTASIRKHLKV